ncbi:nucleotide exchange factor GrpE [Rugosimonospora acidiphila]|uniref:Protein GrpE n=1 Tax=Rugosimonospora acidiphila TaxID=556531 RepID=A0ABP9RWG6_9ACTN
MNPSSQPEPGGVPLSGPRREETAGTAGPRMPSGAPPGLEQLSDIEQRWRRAMSDLDNLRRRYDRQMARDQANERCQVVAAWLPVVDNLDLAVAHAGSGEGGVVEGVRAIRDQAVAVLSELGYPRHDEIGVPFDPVTHEALSVECPADQPPGVVLRVLRPGYGDGDRQLRPASVVVSGEGG